VKIGSKATEVSFSITVPRALIDKLSKKETPPPGEKKL
jgi:hypothetical protein